MIEKIELRICDECNCISTGNPEEEIPCMQCGETMARVEFVRFPLCPDCFKYHDKTKTRCN